MSDYNWCHGPECHTKETQSRVRGSADNKVLRTIKIKVRDFSDYRWGHGDNEDRHYFYNKISKEQRPLTEEQFNDNNYTLNER